MHRQIGNAVPWPVSRALGKELQRSLMAKWERDDDDSVKMEVDYSAFHILTENVRQKKLYGSV